jgi:hypothetical protein
MEYVYKFPSNELILIIDTKLKKNLVIVHNIRNYLSYVKHCQKTHDNKIYLQKDGLALGSPSSSLVLKIFLQRHEYN